MPFGSFLEPNPTTKSQFSPLFFNLEFDSKPPLTLRRQSHLFSLFFHSVREKGCIAANWQCQYTSSYRKKECQGDGTTVKLNSPNYYWFFAQKKEVGNRSRTRFRAGKGKMQKRASCKYFFGGHRVLYFSLGQGEKMGKRKGV